MPTPKVNKMTLADIRALPDTPATRDLLREYMSDPENWTDIQKQMTAEGAIASSADNTEGESSDDDE